MASVAGIIASPSIHKEKSVDLEIRLYPLSRQVRGCGTCEWWKVSPILVGINPKGFFFSIEQLFNLDIVRGAVVLACHLCHE